jgi:hypothetical protein
VKLHVEIDEQELRRLVMADVQCRLGEIIVSEKDVQIQVKSKQNYRSEWELAAFRAIVDIDTRRIKP